VKKTRGSQVPKTWHRQVNKSGSTELHVVPVALAYASATNGVNVGPTNHPAHNLPTATPMPKHSANHGTSRMQA